MTRNGTETRKGQDREAGLGAEHDGPVAATGGDAPSLSNLSPTQSEIERVRDAIHEARFAKPGHEYVPWPMDESDREYCTRLAKAALTASDNGRLIELLLEVEAAARHMPRATPGPGACGTMHDFKIEAGTVWTLDLALVALDKFRTALNSQGDK